MRKKTLTYCGLVVNDKGKTRATASDTVEGAMETSVVCGRR